MNAAKRVDGTHRSIVSPLRPQLGKDEAMRNFEIADWNGTFLADDEDDEWDECSHTMSCACETCMQNYPERFYVDPDTGEWENIHRVDREEGQEGETMVVNQAR